MSLEPGTRLGQYEIVAPLGVGGMGEVYRAHDTMLNRPVAVKLLSDELADAAAPRRFQREAQTASSLNHPHILTVLDAGEIEGRQYLVTEYIDGDTLKDWAGSPGNKDRRSWRDFVELIVGVADGLGEADPSKFMKSPSKSPAVAAVLRALDDAMAEAGRLKPKRTTG